MKVSELRELVNTLPEGMQQHEFDKLDVFFSNGDNFTLADVEQSGYVIGQDGCDAAGNPIADVPFFGILSKEA